MPPPSTITRAEFNSVTGELILVPDPERLVHLQFRRFAGCPICNLHLRSFVSRHDELERAGVRAVVFFHSPADELAEHTADLPFATVADPDKVVYADSASRPARGRCWTRAAGRRSCAAVR